MWNVSSMGTLVKNVPNAVNADLDGTGYDEVMADDEKKLRQFIRAWRQFRGKSLDDLSGDTGISKGRLSEIERGKRRYNQDQIELIADALKCSLGDLLDTDPTAETESKVSLGLLLSDVPDDQKEQAIRTVRSTLKSFKAS